MTLKKWRPFWSYDVEKTERWLSRMAAEGKKLSGLNRLTRTFLFDEGKREEAEYQIVYDKRQIEIPRTLAESGWTNVLTEGDWQFARNAEKPIRTYPARDNLLKRNRMHSIVLTCISIYYSLQLLIPLMLTLLVLSNDGEISIESSPLWSLTALYFLQVIGVIFVTIQMTRKLRAFERKYYDIGVDREVPVGRTFSKWKPSWATAPDRLEAWLTDMALKGNHLVRVKGMRFTFEKGVPKRVAYNVDFQWKLSPGYEDIHKSTGWKLKYASAYSFMKYALWAKEYEEGELKPQLTYDESERRAKARRLVLAYGISGLIGFAWILIMFLFLWKNDFQGFEWSLYYRFLAIVFIGAILMHIHVFIRTVRFLFRSRASF